MPARDPRLALARLVARLERRAPYVTLADVERAAARRPTATLPPDQVAALVQAALDDLLLLSDRRTIFEPADQTFHDEDIYRVNRRHPLVRGKLL